MARNILISYDYRHKLRLGLGGRHLLSPLGLEIEIEEGRNILKHYLN
jgi:hypothetical protein